MRKKFLLFLITIGIFSLFLYGNASAYNITIEGTIESDSLGAGTNTVGDSILFIIEDEFVNVENGVDYNLSFLQNLDLIVEHTAIDGNYINYWDFQFSSFSHFDLRFEFDKLHTLEIIGETNIGNTGVFFHPESTPEEMWVDNDYGGSEIEWFIADIDTISVLGFASVPEPTTLLLLGSGLVGFAGFRKKYRKS